MKKRFLILILFLLTGFIANAAYGQDHLAKATSFFFKQDYRNAIKEYTLESQNRPNDARIYYNLGVCYEKLNELENALTNYSIAIQKDPNMKEVQAALGRLQNTDEVKNQITVTQANMNANKAFLKKDYQTAIEEYKRVVKITPTNFQVLYNLGVCHEQIGDFRNALSFFERAQEVDPNSQNTKKAIERLSLLNKNSMLQLYKHQLDSLVDNNLLELAQQKIRQIQRLGGDDAWVSAKNKVIQARVAEQEAKNKKAEKPVIPPQDTVKIAISDSIKKASLQEKIDEENNNTIFIGGSLGLVVFLMLVFLLRRGKKGKQNINKNEVESGSKDAPELESLPITNIYDSIQDHYNTKKTGVLRIQGNDREGKTIDGEIRLLNGNIVDAVTNERQGVDAVYQILDIENPTSQSLQKIQVTDSGNIRQATLPLLMKWTLGMKKEE
ncbi:tetratricopeptide repeat protein [candidate division KSB1 bacterium]|nr:tetratricopeptide repeat protein [candidate division KSB1 bacterium]